MILAFQSFDVECNRCSLYRKRLWDDESRQERESFWIKKLKTLSPNGINEKK
jgi:hypothetical protein